MDDFSPCDIIQRDVQSISLEDSEGKSFCITVYERIRRTGDGPNGREKTEAASEADGTLALGASPPNANTEQRLTDLELRFGEYLESFNATPPFGPSQLQHHLQTLDLLARFASAADAACDEGFADSLAATLRSWDIGKRYDTRLVQPSEFRNQLRRIALDVARLEHLRIDDPAMDDISAARSIWQIIRDLNILTKSGIPVKSKVVSGTKLLHHLLPNLVFPIDNEYTGTFFGWDGFGHHSERFTSAFCQVVRIARAVAPHSYVGEGWNSSRSKVVDNAIVGYCQFHGIMSRNKKSGRKNQELIEHLKQTGQWEEYKRLFKGGVQDGSDPESPQG